MGGYPVVDSRMQQYGVMSTGSGKPVLMDELANNHADSALGHKMQSQYSTGGAGEPAVGKSMDGRFAATMNTHGIKTGGPFGNPNSNMLRSPQLAPMNQRTSIRNNQRPGGNFPQTQHMPQRGKTVGGPNGPTYYMPSAHDRSSQQSRQKPAQGRSVLNSGGAIPSAQKDNLGESSFNQSFHATGASDKFGSANRSQIASQQVGRMNYMQKTPQALEARGVRQNTALMNYPQGGEKHQDSLFESSKASTNNPAQIVRRQFGKNVALTSTTPNRQKMVLTQN